VRGLAICLALLAAPLHAQDGWPNLDQLLFSTLTASGTAEASFWLPDSADADAATRALGIVYEYIPGSAGSTSIASGVYQRVPEGWQFAGTVSGLFGQSPTDAAFGPGHVDVTTIMLGPDEPRCCPTLPARWRIDLSTFSAQRLN
jgi:hypothetical protein